MENKKCWTTSQLLFGDGTLNFKTENVSWFSCWFFEWLTWRRFCSQIWRWHAYWEETTKHNAKQLLMLQNGEKHKRELDGNQTNWCCEVPQLRIHRCPLPEFPPLVSKPGESTKEGTPGTCWFLKPWGLNLSKTAWNIITSGEIWSWWLNIRLYQLYFDVNNRGLHGHDSFYCQTCHISAGNPQLKW